MNKKISHILSLVTLSFLLTLGVLPLTAQGQQYPYGYDRDSSWQYHANRRYNRNYVGNIIRRVENSSDRFEREVDRFFQFTNIHDSRRETNISRDVDDFTNALDTLRREFDSRDNWWETRHQVEMALIPARDVATRMRNNQFDYRIRAQWRVLQRDLNQLAQTYNLPLIR